MTVEVIAVTDNSRRKMTFASSGSEKEMRFELSGQDYMLEEMLR